MGLPDFDEHGNLPPGYHRASVEDVHERLVEPFGASPSRQAIFDYWVHHRRALMELAAVPAQWLAGSFVTSKLDPADMDLVTVLDGESFDDLPRHRRLLIRTLCAGHYTQDFWDCDTYPLLSYPRGHPGHPASLAARELWSRHFGKDRDGHERGLVEVVPDAHTEADDE